MANPYSSFVNGARNVCWLSGVLKRIDDTTVLICPSSDITRGIQVTVRRGLVVPADNNIVEVLCHLHGTHSKDTNSRSLRVEAAYFKRATITALPKRLSMLQPFVDRNNPLASLAELRANIEREMQRAHAEVGQDKAEGVADMMIRDVSKDRSSAGWQNKVILTGFVGAKAMRQATDTEDAHLYVQLHQHAETDRALPIRIYGSIASFGQHMKTLYPINIVGELDYSDTTNEEGVVTRQLYVSIKKSDVGSASAADFENRQIPGWWLRAFAAHKKRQEEANAASRGVVAAPAVPAPVPPPKPVVVVADDDEIVEGM